MHLTPDLGDEVYSWGHFILRFFSSVVKKEKAIYLAAIPSLSSGVEATCKGNRQSSLGNLFSLRSWLLLLDFNL